MTEVSANRALVSGGQLGMNSIQRISSPQNQANQLERLITQNKEDMVQDVRNQSIEIRDSPMDTSVNLASRSQNLDLAGNSVGVKLDVAWDEHNKTIIREASYDDFSKSQDVYGTVAQYLAILNQFSMLILFGL